MRLMTEPIFSFIICSHRAPFTLNMTIESFELQQKLESCEIILVNNGFSAERQDELQLLLEALQLRCSGFSFRIMNEEKPGLGFARKKGFLSASGEYFVLLDDDNTIERDFIGVLYDFIDAEGGVGCICPRVIPRWVNSPPPPWLQEFGSNCLSYTATPKCPSLPSRLWRGPKEVLNAMKPPGGGMIIHEKVARSYLEAADANRLSLGRGPQALWGCEDYDIFSQVKTSLPVAAYCDNLIVYHRIPSDRLQPAYLNQLNYEMTHSYGILFFQTRRYNTSIAIIRFLIGLCILVPIRSKLRIPEMRLRSLREIGLFHGYLSARLGSLRESLHEVVKDSF